MLNLLVIKNNKNLKIYFILLLITFSFTYLGKVLFFQNYCYNISSSVPKGIYKLEDIDTLKKNQMVYLKIPDNAKNIIWEREYLPKSIDTLIKYVKGVPGDIVEIFDHKIYINSIFEGNIRKVDSEGNILPSELPEKYTLKENEYILLGLDDDSYDSRYFGIVRKNQILKKAYKI